MKTNQIQNDREQLFRILILATKKGNAEKIAAARSDLERFDRMYDLA